MDEIFTNHQHLVWYHSPEECVEKVGYYLDREAERRRIARAGCWLVRNYYTFRHTAARIMELLWPEG